MNWIRWCGLVLSCLGGTAHGITIQDTSSAGYLTGSGAYTGVARILGTFNTGVQFNCTGALVAPTVVITAGHCVASATQWDVNFETASGIATIGVSGSSLHPLYASRTSSPNLPQFDVALLQLGMPAPLDAAVYTLSDGSLPLTFGDLTGSVVDQVGYGLGGNPSGALGVGVRRRAQNRVAGIAAGEPDQPLVTLHNFSASGEPGNFGLVAAGDSGGPMFFSNDDFTNVIIGIASASSIPAVASGTYTTGSYFGLHTNVFEPLTRSWLTTAMINTPEPGSALLLVSGITLLALLRRR
ncbi:MAG: trypsin-like serine protease [Acidobacteria bacterium]|nr:trypsin-like serine protease [Bryobacteraceae bacterium CoA2 C42]